MNNFYFPISNYFKVNLDFTKFSKQQNRCDKSILSDDVHSWIKKNLNAKILWIEIFHLNPYESYTIHCDGHEIDNKCKLNYIVNSNQSVMNWYEAIEQDKIVNHYSTSNTKYLKLDLENARLLYTANLTGLNVVNVGNFHTVVNGPEDRYCLSIVIGDEITGDRLNFNEVLRRLKNE